ncbi:DUF4433 domain-containing protein [Pseudomonas resinovorans]|uniref:DUF4433 domain-containing protein n=1 Tax=Metapseudomonas resinovorans TaxID=53412 RepID=A0ABT4Y6Y0_METRE|nr:DarT ssDNA thymidine ADP-ribosyltransferase family protein [Pseudomonas resinovorans]MDA8484589.1 DUF4433 domain-containing protein [Pseudomonas resinovorans]
MERTVKKLGVKYLCHFTRGENIENILSNGIIPRSILERGTDQAIFNDQFRMDGNKDASCFSIGFPNYKMFYRLRKQDEKRPWVVVVLSESLLWEKRCYFYKENAAAASMRIGGLESKVGVSALREMYVEWPGKPSRANLNIQEEWPTNPQAEVMIEGVVEPQYIRGVAVNSTGIRDYLHQRHPMYKISYYPSFFGPRIDYEHW